MSAAGQGPTPVIEARRMAKRYGSLAAIDAIDLTLAAGQSVVIFGHNGAGKSTLLRLFATLIRPSAGRLRLFGEDPAPSDAGPWRRRIGFLSHQTFLYEHLTARENLLFYARLYGLADAGNAVREAVQSVRLSERLDDRVATYSRGMQQRLSIARTLLHHPDIILLDEPFTGLDRESSTALEERLRRERRAGRTCVMATHDLDQGLRFADRVLVLLEGRLAFDGPAGGLDPRRLEALLLAPSIGAAPGTS